LEKLRSGFYFFVFGGVAGVSPVEGGSGKAGGFEAWGKAFPLLCFLKICYAEYHFTLFLIYGIPIVSKIAKFLYLGRILPLVFDTLPKDVIH
jgi:hypothetical protein